MGKTAERFMRLYVDRWLDDPKIRGAGDDGEREGGLTLAQEAVYFRLCLAQFRSADGYLPNRKAFLCDASGCPIGASSELIQPVLDRFFRRTKDGSRLYNLRVRFEWEQANAKSQKAKEANRVRWEEAKRSESLSNTSGDPSGDPTGASKSKRESKRDITDTPLPPTPPPDPTETKTETAPPQPPAIAGGARPSPTPSRPDELVARVVRERWSPKEPLDPKVLRKIRQALKSSTPEELIDQVRAADHPPPWLVVVDPVRI